MSKSTDDTNELESYGVWVKHPADATEESSLESLNSEETGDLDLPDFEDSDFSDMFKDDSEFSTEENNFIDDDNTTLSVDELANITSNAETVEEESITPEDYSFDDIAVDSPDDINLDDISTESSDDINLDDISVDSADDSLEIDDSVFDFDTENSEVTTEDISTDEPLVEETADTFDINFDELSDDSTSVEAPVEDSVPEDFFVEESTSDELNIDDFATETESVTEESEPVVEESADDEFTFEDITNNDGTSETIEETSVGEEEINLDDFGFDIDASDETAATEESAVVSTSGDEEISLDDFMDEGFSDDSVAAGNNGYAPDAIPTTSDSEEISLDDFGFTDEAPVQETVEDSNDEAPLDMDLNFDDSVDSIETEENLSVEEDFDYESEDTDEEETTEETETPVEEEVSMDDFTSDTSNFEAESIDLSDFGIDSDAEETPVTQDVTSAKLKESKVDYDLSVGNANNAAPVVTEIATPSEDLDTVEDIDDEEVTTTATDSTSVSAALLQQIVNDLSGLKNEISQLKNNLEEMKTTGVVPENGFEVAAEPEAKEESGFFSSDDGDDTIALSFDELDNIMNNAEFSTEETKVENSEVESAEEPVIDDNLFVEPETEETAVEEQSEDLPESMDFNFDNAETEDFSKTETSFELDTDDLPSEISIPKYEEEAEEPVITEDNTSADSIFVEAEGSEEEPNFDVGEELSNDTVEEEPVFEEEATSEEPAIEESEISLEDDNATDSIFVEAEGADEEPNFDVGEELSNDTVEEEPVFEEETTSKEPVFEDTGIEEVATEEEISVDAEPSFEEEPNFDIGEELSNDTVEEEPVFEEETPTEEPVIEEKTEEFSSVDNIFDSIEVETTENEEPVIEETSVEPVADETEEFDPFVSDSTKDDVTESDINFLTSDSAPVEETKAPNDELKQDIKSVLLYMDQLLENLPEEKIIEFAKSDEFTTYKKLFSELGLS